MNVVSFQQIDLGNVLTKNVKTEELILNAARELILEKGVAGTKTRDITEKAGINVALLNYYFRSKKNLFRIIMQENLDQFFSQLQGVFQNEQSSFDEKIKALVDHYINLLTVQPDIPLYIINELKTNREYFVAHFVDKIQLQETIFFKQLCADLKSNINPMHIMINIMSMTIFPFIVHPIIEHIADVNHEHFLAMMEERKQWIPIWIKGIVNAESH